MVKIFGLSCTFRVSFSVKLNPHFMLCDINGMNTFLFEESIG